MTEPGAASDLLNSPAPTAAPSSWQPIGMPVTPAAFDAPEAAAARAEIQTLKADKEFFKRLVIDKDPEANAKWSALHGAGYPSPAPTSPEQMPAHEAARTEVAWNEHLAWLRTQWAITPEQAKELRGGVVRQEVYDWAKEERARLIADAAFRDKLLNRGDRGAKEQWGRVTSILGLRPVRAA